MLLVYFICASIYSYESYILNIGSLSENTVIATFLLALERNVKFFKIHRLRNQKRSNEKISLTFRIPIKS